MKDKFKTRTLILFGVILFLIAFAFWYKLSYSMDLAENQNINSPSTETKILIATQGSDFKKAVVANIIDFYRKDSIYLKTIDVSELPQIDSSVYNAIVILHTWEYGKAPKSVSSFIAKNIYDKEKIIVFATSGAGTNTIDGIDAMSGESIIENVDDASDRIKQRINLLLK